MKFTFWINKLLNVWDASVADDCKTEISVLFPFKVLWQVVVELTSRY
jgi:hypothetical protein